jgi:hypothetical protein
LDTFVGGIQIQFDHEVDPASINRATCYVSLKMPLADSSSGSAVWGNPAIGYQTMILAGETNTLGKTVTWKITDTAKNWLQSKVSELLGQQESRILAHLTLKGNHIWSADAPDMYLDSPGWSGGMGNSHPQPSGRP